METKRLFFALWPDHRQRDSLRDVINPVAKTVEGRMVDRRDWHVTLSFIGTFPAHRVPHLLERAGEVRVEPFQLTFDRLEYWPRPRVASLSAATVPPELDALVAALNGVGLDFGLKPEDRVYRPHITVVRNARAFTTERLTQRVTTSWSDFVLMESVPGPHGTRYVPVKQ
ncbi:MAG: RNA 2',3'-cyclic phosphodiesterase [Proteobacteria bacterium]|nr:RNA 2',3'-cyclic phosphodiesterase [Pseudomonadota bacterium]